MNNNFNHNISSLINQMITDTDIVGPSVMEETEQPRKSEAPIEGFVAVQPGKFVKVQENVNGKLRWRLYVIEDGLGDGFIRKYSEKNSNKKTRWFCTECNTAKNRIVRENKKYAMDLRSGSSQEAIYDEESNTLLVSAKHTIAKCSPFPISKENLQSIFQMYAKKKSEAPTASNNANQDRCDISRLSLSPQNGLAAVLQNILTSPPGVLWSSNPATNPMRFDKPCSSMASSRIILPPQLVAQPVVATSAVQSVDPVVGDIIAKPPEAVQTNDVVQPAPTENVLQRSDENSNVISEGASNDVVEDENGSKSRELSIISLPDDPMVEDVKAEDVNSQMEVNETYHNNIAADEEMEIEEKFDILSFYAASDKTLAIACRKFGLDYSRTKALHFWANIKVVLIKSHSNSILSGPKLDGFESLSLLLTGTRSFGCKMHINVNKKLEANESLKVRYDPSQRLNMATAFCDEHFKLVAHWISCRIGVYEGGVLTKYGDWTSSNTTDLIILIEKNGEKYAPIFQL